MRITESKLRQLIRETLLTEAKFQYSGGDSIHGVFDFWRYFLRSDFKNINGRWPTYGEYIEILQKAIPGFTYEYVREESPDIPLESAMGFDPGGKFLNEVYRQLVKFVDNDDRRDLRVSRAIERVGKEMRRQSKEILRMSRIAELEGTEREEAAYSASYEPTAPIGSPLGKYAFSPQRQAARKRPPMERNTPVESALLRSIINHFEGMRPLTRKQAEMVMGFIRDGLYSDVYREPPLGTYYRGMVLPIEDLVGMGITVPRMKMNVPQEIEGNFVIKPLGDRFSSSWSRDIGTAEKFSKPMLGQGTHDVYSVVFAANSGENPGRFIDAEGLYDIEMEEINFYAQEKEVVGLGAINANRVRIMRLA